MESKDDSCDSALAETINGLYNAESIHRRAPWKLEEAVELASFECVHGSTTIGCSCPSGDIRLQKLKQAITGNSPVKLPRWEESGVALLVGFDTHLSCSFSDSLAGLGQVFAVPDADVSGGFDRSLQGSQKRKFSQDGQRADR